MGSEMCIRDRSVIQESLQHRTVIKTLEQGDRHIGKLDDLQDVLRSQIFGRTRFSLSARMLVAFAFSGGYLTAFLWGAIRLSTGSITFGTMTAFLQLVGKVQRPALDLSRLLPSFINALTAVERLIELEELPAETSGASQLFLQTPDLQLKDVTFSYSTGDRSILKHFSCNFPAGSCTAVLGETGAGKSILINGINAVLGQRVTKDIVRTGCKKAIITALFSDLSEEVKTLLDELGISYDNDEITVTREINSDGGSNARINSRTASIAMLREIGELLITIHGQHDNQILLSPEKHINVLDSFGDTEQLIADYKNDFKKLQSLAKLLEKSKRSRVEKRDRIILLKSRIDDLKEADITEEEYIELENEFRQIQNTDRIFKSLQVINVILSLSLIHI